MLFLLSSCVVKEQCNYDANNVVFRIIDSMTRQDPVAQFVPPPGPDSGMRIQIQDIEDFQFGVGFKVFDEDYLSDIEKTIDGYFNEGVSKVSWCTVSTSVSPEKLSNQLNTSVMFSDFDPDKSAFTHAGTGLNGYFQFGYVSELNYQGRSIYGIGIRYFCGKSCVNHMLFFIEEFEGRHVILDRVGMYPNVVY